MMTLGAYALVKPASKPPVDCGDHVFRRLSPLMESKHMLDPVNVSCILPQEAHVIGT